MLIVLAILLTAVTLFAVAYPIVTKSRTAGTTTDSTQETLAELVAQRNAAFQALRDLNFDRRVGKITAEDFTVFEAHLKQGAADTLRRLDEWEAEADQRLGGEISQAVASRRATKVGGHRCPQCGRLAAADDKFSAGCGAALPEAAAQAACPKCGRPLEAGDLFSAGCGQALG